jgi:hypothetical protein
MVFKQFEQKKKKKKFWILVIFDLGFLAFFPQKHRKYPKIIENHVFWTLCELLAYCEEAGMFLVHFWTNIGRFTVF